MDKRLVTRLGFPESAIRTAGQRYARWDGKGVPAIKGGAISPALLATALAHSAKQTAIRYNRRNRHQELTWQADST